MYKTIKENLPPIIYLLIGFIQTVLIFLFLLEPNSFSEEALEFPPILSLLFVLFTVIWPLISISLLGYLAVFLMEIL